MKKSIVVGALVVGIIAAARAQDIVIDSIRGNGAMSFWGAQVGTTAQVEWAASLTDAGRTNWQGLTNIFVTSDLMTNDIPMFFRVRGVPDTNVLNGLIAYYPLDGNALDVIGTNNGTIVGATATTNRLGSSAHALSFNGNAYVTMNISSLPLGSSSRSVTGWVRSSDGLKHNNADHVANWGYAMTGRAFGFMLFLTNHWYGYGGNVDAGYDLDSGVTADTQWHHFAVTYDGSDMKVYLDGALDASRSMLLNTGDSGTGGGRTLVLGVSPELNPNNYFHGEIDNIRIYDRALRIEDVQRLYQRPE